MLFKDNKYLEGKISGLCAEPDLRAVQLCENDEFCIIACDGLWDVMSHEVSVQFVRAALEKCDDPQRVAQALTQEALKQGSTDNITGQNALLSFLVMGDLVLQRSCTEWIVL